MADQLSAKNTGRVLGIDVICHEAKQGQGTHASNTKGASLRNPSVALVEIPCPVHDYKGASHTL